MTFRHLRSFAFVATAFVCSPGIAHATSITTTAMPSSVTLGSSTVTLNDSATITGATSLDTLTFLLQDPSAFLVDAETVASVSDGVTSTPTGYMLPVFGTATGTYNWSASYGGVTSAPEPVTVLAASPTLTTEPGEIQAQFGSDALVDTAVLSGGYFETGTIQFQLFGPTNNLLLTQTEAVSGNGNYTGGPVAVFGLANGTYQWVVSYSGDANNNGVTSPLGAEPFVLGSATPVPEPATLTLLGLGLIGASRNRRRRMRC